MWSSTGMSRSLPAAISCWVVAISPAEMVSDRTYAVGLSSGGQARKGGAPASPLRSTTRARSAPAPHAAGPRGTADTGPWLWGIHRRRGSPVRLNLVFGAILRRDSRSYGTATLPIRLSRLPSPFMPLLCQRPCFDKHRLVSCVLRRVLIPRYAGLFRQELVSYTAMLMMPDAAPPHS
jgi:hypothetical protein